MKKHTFQRMLLLISIYFIIYITSTILNFEILSAVLSPIGALFSFFAIFKIYLSSKDNKFGLLSIGFAFLSWAIGDILLLIFYLVANINAQNNFFVLSFYTFTNIFLAVWGVSSTLHILKKWNVIQLVIDIMTITVLSILLVWIIFLDKNIELIALICKDGLASVASLVIDFMAFVGLVVWLLSIRRGKVAYSNKIKTAGFLVFVITDIYYYYIYFHENYLYNSLIDNIYIAAFLVMVIGVFMDEYDISENRDEKPVLSYSNIGLKHKGFILLVSPFIIIIYKGFDIPNLILIGFVILVYEILSTYVQSAIKNEMMLNREKELNLLLEKRIAEDTKELIEKNKELIKINEKLDYISNQDILTKLFNRRYFIKHLEEKISEVTKSETVALLFIDLDRFKTINDTYGHDIGDKVLIVIAKRLRKFKKDNVIIARLGGDEFVFVFKGQYGYSDVEDISSEIIKSCNEPIEIDQYTFHITLSIGISIYPLDAKDSRSLMRNADMAMYQSKELGYNKSVSFNSLLNEKYKRKNEIEIQLKKTDFNKEFRLFYQPQFSIPDKKLIGIEALLRWSNPVLGFVSPSEFIPIAEEIDKIVSIGEWVMKEAIRQISIWNKKYSMQIKMGFNISPKQLDNTNFICNLINLMEANSVEPKWMDVEITESVAIESEYSIMDIANLFKGIGVSISIDDFGTGYSSLSYLKMFPFDRIKIAKPLIDGITTDKFDREIVKSIITLSKTMGISTIAEGVASKEQFNLLGELGCSAVQGYYLGMPIPADEFENKFFSKV